MIVTDPTHNIHTYINPNKRKFDEFETMDTNANSKKRKCSDMNVKFTIEANKLLKTKCDALIQANKDIRHSNNELRKDNLYYKQSMNSYKKEINKWKSNYKKLQTNLKSPQIKIKTEQNMNDTIYDCVLNRLLSLGYDRHQIMTRIALYNHSGQGSDFVFNQILPTFSANIETVTIDASQATAANTVKIEPLSFNTAHTKPKRTNFKIMHTQTANENNHISLEFEHSFIVSVHCHFCHTHFCDIRKYRKHLQKHYCSDKEWRVCEFGCNKPPKFISSEAFIQHITTHTNDRPFECTVTMNGIKCTYSASTKTNIKTHWKRHVQKMKKCSDNCVKRKQSRKKLVIRKKKRPVMNNSLGTQAQFHIAINCHICRKYFTDISEYGLHLQKHYSMDQTKTWLHCDFLCDTNEIFSQKTFIAHIATHTKDGPFKCDIITNGHKCDSSFGEREALNKHLQTHSSKKYKSKKCDKSEAEFEESFYIDIHCHFEFCKQHFSDIHKYRNHLRTHYKDDPNKTWMKCDFVACANLKGLHTNFVNHIASHTKQYPYKCNVSVEGRRCKAAAGTRFNAKRHWNSKHNRKKQKKLQRTKMKMKTKTCDGEDSDWSDCWSESDESDDSESSMYSSDDDHSSDSSSQYYSD